MFLPGSRIIAITKKPLKNISEMLALNKKRSLYVINEHFELMFYAKMTTQAAFQRFPNREPPV